MSLLLGCIADDFTGASDLAGVLVKFGMRMVVMLGTPQGDPPTDVDAVVVALKSRTSPVEDAIQTSLRALAWLRATGCRQFFFKYCSTFDSTPKGNIGPVAEALMDALGLDFTIACPAFPENRRTVYQGHLFVGPDLLSESGMRNYGLTPMTDASLVRVLAAQSRHRVGLIDLDTVRRGPAAVEARVVTLRSEGFGFAIADATTIDDVDCLGRACAELPLLTGGSALARGLPANFRERGLLPDRFHADALPETEDIRAVVAGSCSIVTRGQVARMAAAHPAFKIDFDMLREGSTLDRAIDWARDRLRQGPVLIYSSAEPGEVKSVQARYDDAGARIEETLAAIARRLVEDLRVRRLIVAGGETSGAAVQALGANQLRIGPEICPGVPWIGGRARDGSALALSLKSGNFGSPDFFLIAWQALGGGDRP